MGELFLAVLAFEAEVNSGFVCESAAIDTTSRIHGVGGALDVNCAVALGSSFRQAAVPTSFLEASHCWQVPSSLSVCTVLVLSGDRTVGKASIPVMRLKRSAGRCVDRRFPVVAARGPTPSQEASQDVVYSSDECFQPIGTLHLLLHYSTSGTKGTGGRAASGTELCPPVSFQRMYRELVHTISKRSVDEVEVVAEERSGVFSECETLSRTAQPDTDASVQRHHQAQDGYGKLPVAQNFLLRKSQTLVVSSNLDHPDNFGLALGSSSDSPEDAHPRADEMAQAQPVEEQQAPAEDEEKSQNEQALGHDNAQNDSCDLVEVSMGAVHASSDNDGDLFEMLQESCRLLQLRCTRLFPPPPTAPRVPGSQCQGVGMSALHAFDDCCKQLMAEKSAMEEEIDKLNAHWQALTADHAAKEFEMRGNTSSCEAVQEELAQVERDLVKASMELQETQREASAQLLARKSLQQEMKLCVSAFNTEAAAQRQVGDELREERASLREEAVDLGQALQRKVLEADQMICEEHYRRSEVDMLDEARVCLGRSEHEECGGSPSVAAAVERIATLCASIGAAGQGSVMAPS